MLPFHGLFQRLEKSSVDADMPLSGSLQRFKLGDGRFQERGVIGGHGHHPRGRARGCTEELFREADRLLTTGRAGETRPDQLNRIGMTT
jgi:hypothetical protein